MVIKANAKGSFIASTKLDFKIKNIALIWLK